jgi:short-subunit dehydrogenase
MRSPRLKPLSQQVIVITGASSGMGLSTARIAARAGACVFLAARDAVALRRICDEIHGTGGQAGFLAIDVGSEAEVEALAAAAIKRFGGFDSWINVAGVCLVGPLKDVATADHQRLFQTNYWGVVHGSMAAARHFRERGQPGALVNVGSAASDVVLPFAGTYAASKFAVKAFTNALRVELMHERLPVSVTLIKPSAVDSLLTEHAKTTLGAATRLPGPRYTPAVVARAILDAVQHPRREIAIGSPALIGAALAHLFPRATERLMSRIGADDVVDADRPAPSSNAIDGVPTEGQVRSGRYPARDFSVTTAAQTNPGTTASLLVLGLAAVALIAGRKRIRPAPRA